MPCTFPGLAGSASLGSASAAGSSVGTLWVMAIGVAQAAAWALLLLLLLPSSSRRRSCGGVVVVLVV